MHATRRSAILCGIKIYRFQKLKVIVYRHIRRLAHPSRIVTLTYAGHRWPQDVPTVLALLAAYVGMVALVTLVLATMGIDLVTALSSAVQAIGNVCPGPGEIVGPAGNFGKMPEGAK